MNVPGRERGRRSVLRFREISAPKILVLGALGVLLYVAHVAFIPIALALLLALVLSGPVEALHQRGIPRGLSAFVILAVALGFIGGALALLWKPAQHWYAEAPQTIRSIQRKVAPAEKIVSRVDDISSSATILSGANPGRSTETSGTRAAETPAHEPSGWAAAVFSSTVGAAVSLLTFVILTLFLLAGGPPMLARMTAAFVDDLNASHVLAIIESVRREVGRFYVTTAAINFGLGCATTLVMWLWGMPTPYVWGIVAAVLNFIPYAGSVTTLAIVTVVAAMTFDRVPQILGVAGSYMVLAGIEGQIVQPLFVGRRLEINPLLIFLGLWLGGLFWGLAGVLLATPALVALKVVAQHADRGSAVLDFLGPNHDSEKRDKRRLVQVGNSSRHS
jgi:predicted PurR-regulated permease PerM